MSLNWIDEITKRTVRKTIGRDKQSKSREMIPGVKSSIRTVMGEAKYIGTEIENSNGRWNDDYYTKDGYWVIHEGNKHHIYYVRPE